MWTKKDNPFREDVCVCVTVCDCGVMITKKSFWGLLSINIDITNRQTNLAAFNPNVYPVSLQSEFAF